MSLTSFASLSPSQLRPAIRRSEWRKPTAGLAPGYVQANFVILPAHEAGDFHRFCQKNPKPCPLLAISEVGDPCIPVLGKYLDMRTDTPRYRVFRDGELMAEPDDILEYWRDDLVTFVIGCSFTFEHSLLENGIGIRHIEQGRNVPMYRTTIETARAGNFHGPMVVSMRPMKAADAIRAIQITSRFPGVHGAPVHIGDPALIGIMDLANPDYGDAVDVYADELPVFWACGATPQAVIGQAKPGLCITHSPGHMLITDLHNNDFSTRPSATEQPACRKSQAIVSCRPSATFRRSVARVVCRKPATIRQAGRILAGRYSQSPEKTDCWRIPAQPVNIQAGPDRS